MIRNISTLLVLLCIFTLNLYSNNSPFVTERVTTDFNSVLYNNGKILCFGDYGIITHATDDGSSWQQTKLNEKYNIYNVIQVDNNLVGLTQNAIIKSSDNGVTWEIKDLTDTLLAIAGLEKGTIAVLMKDKMLEYDLNFNEINIVALDPSYLAKEITSLGNSVYLPIQDFKLLKHDFDKGNNETIELRNSINCSSCMKAKSIKTNENNLYLIANNVLYESLDNGLNWYIKANGVSEKYYLDSDNVFEINCNKSSKPIASAILFNSSEYLYIFDYFQIDKFGTRQKTNNDTIISKLTYKFNLTNMISVGKKKIAVGKNNLIITSDDEGKNWTFKSIYNIQSNKIEIKEDSVLYTSGNLNLFTSKNKGITFEVCNYQDTIKDYYSSYNYSINNKGEGICIFTINDPNQDKSILRTYDYGKTFNADFFPNNDAAKSIMTTKFYGDRFLLVSNMNFIGYEGTLITHVNLDLKRDTTIKVDTALFYQILESENKTLYAYGYYQSDLLIDSLGGKSYKTKKTKLYTSTDRGLSWKDAQLNVPFTNRYPLCKVIDNKILTYVSSDGDFNNRYYWNHVVYDIATNTFDSIVYPKNVTPNSLPLKYNDYYIFTTYYTLYYTKNLFDKKPKWDSISLNELIPQWNTYNYDDQNYFGDNALSIIGGDYNGIILIIQKSEYYNDGTYTGKIYMNGVAKLKLKSSSSVIEDDKINLFNYKPYPIPAVNSVKSLMHWNSSYNIEEAEIGIYDIYGAKLNNINYSIQKLEPFSGNLIVDCTNILSGVYFARVALGGENLNIPIVVSK